MSAIGGDIIEITINHATLGSRTVYPKAGEDSTIILGGFRSEDEDQGIDGSGRMIDKMTRKRWSAETTVAWDNNIALEHEFLVSIAESPVEADFTITHVSGTVWGGKGKPVGDMEAAGMTATFKLKLAGGGKLSKIA